MINNDQNRAKLALAINNGEGDGTMITITLKDWTGLHLSTTTMSEAELGFDGDMAKLQRFAQRVANDKMASVNIEQDGDTIAHASYLTALL